MVVKIKSSVKVELEGYKRRFFELLSDRFHTQNKLTLVYFTRPTFPEPNVNSRRPGKTEQAKKQWTHRQTDKQTNRLTTLPRGARGN